MGKFAFTNPENIHADIYVSFNNGKDLMIGCDDWDTIITENGMLCFSISDAKTRTLHNYQFPLTSIAYYKISYTEE